MSLSDLRRYLPQESKPTATDELSVLFQRANSTESTIRILNDELACGIPESGHGGSTKIWCPYAIEHSDPHDKNCRFYWETDQGYCFAVHGVLDPVFLRSMMWNMSKRAAAEKMIEKAGLGAQAPWRDRVAAVQAEMGTPQTRLADATAARAALTTALSALPLYFQHQYTPEAHQVITEALDTLDPSWSLEDTISWVDHTVSKMELTLQALDG